MNKEFLYKCLRKETNEYVTEVPKMKMINTFTYILYTGHCSEIDSLLGGGSI